MNVNQKKTQRTKNCDDNFFEIYCCIVFRTIYMLNDEAHMIVIFFHRSQDAGEKKCGVYGFATFHTKQQNE